MLVTDWHICVTIFSCGLNRDGTSVHTKVRAAYAHTAAYGGMVRLSSTM